MGGNSSMVLCARTIVVVKALIEASDCKALAVMDGWAVLGELQTWLVT